MHIKRIYNSLPDYNEFFDVYMVGNKIENSESCICLYDLSCVEVNAHLKNVSRYADELKDKYKDKIIDIVIKPTFLFDSIESCCLFIDSSNELWEEDYYDMLTEMQLKFNKPWESVQMLTSDIIIPILEYYHSK